jgi:hypothetical protein
MALLSSLPPWALVEEILRTLVLPTFAAASLMLALVCALTHSVRIRCLGACGALIAGLVAGNHFHHLLDWWPTPWLRGWRVLLPVMAGLSLLATLLAMLPPRTHGGVRLGLRILLAAASTWLLRDTLAPLTEISTYGMLLFVVVLTWEISRAACASIPPHASLLWLTMLWGGAAAALLIFAHSARFSDLAILLTTSLCGVGLIGMWWKLELSFLLAVPCIFLPSLLLAGAANTYSEVPVSAFAWIAFAPAALLLLLLPQIQRWPMRALTLVALIALVIPCAVGVALAARVESLDYGE